MAIVIIMGEAKVSESRRSLIVWEEFTVEYKDGNKFERKRKWQVWFNGLTDINSGDWVEIKGELGTKLEEYEKDGETKSAVGHSINDPQVLQVKPKSVPKEAALDLDDLAKYGNAPF